MKSQHLYTLIGWLAVYGTPVTVKQFFATAYEWKYKKIDKEAIDFCMIAHNNNGFIPEFVEEFVYQRCYPRLRVGEVRGIT